MARPASITVLDGHASVGGTKIAVDTGTATVLLDFGTNYQRQSHFFEEFLHPRPARGLVDLLELGLLPRLRGVYRPDLFPATDYPDRDAGFPGEPPSAVLLSHAHLDHCGALAYVDPSIPVYASPTTLALLRAWQETGQTNVSTEVTYVAPRTPAEGGLLQTERGAPRRHRTYRLLGEPSTGFSAAIARSPVRRGELEGPVPAAGTADPLVRSLGIDAPTVDHSLLGSHGFLLDLDGARIAYTGDVRFHGARGPETEAFLRRLEARSPDVLIVEGTRLRRDDAEPPQGRTSEEEVRSNAEKAVAAEAGRLVIADFGPRNIERLVTFRAVAAATGRQLVVTAKDAYLLQLLSTTEPGIPLDFGVGGMRIWAEPTTRSPGAWSSSVTEAFGGAEIGPEEIERSPGRWIVCFSFFDANDLVDLRRAARGGLWLYSSSEAHGEEQEFDFRRLQHWIDWAGMRARGFSVDGEGTVRFESGYHASGHATEAELVELVRRASARQIIPVHSATPRRYERLLGPEGARLRFPTPGTPIVV